MKKAILRYVSPYQTQLHPLRELLVKCEQFGLAIERDPERIQNYRIAKDEDALTEFTTMAKLQLWMAGFVAGVQFKEAQQ